MNSETYKIFKTGSVTFFTASLFFPKVAKEKVFILYAFVRTFDDLVDSVPQKKEKFFELKKTYYDGLQVGKVVENKVIKDFIELQKSANFDQSWIDAFFASMEMDLQIKQYGTVDDILVYIYGSAEVIGLMMAKIMNLPQESFPYAALLGRAFQYMNMIRDVAEDETFGRTYLPVEEYKKFGLNSITVQEASAKKEEFARFIRSEILRYKNWRSEAEKGFKYIPKRFLIPIQSATDMFDYTIEVIENNPQIVYREKVKPSRPRVIASVIKNII